MTPTLKLVLAMAVVTWLSLLAASLIRARAWTPAGTWLAMGNRDDLPPASALAGRAERAARNTLENFVLFAVIALVAHAAGADGPRVAQGAWWFVAARLAYLPVYYAGIKGLRTVVWAVGIAGLAMMLSALL